MTDASGTSAEDEVVRLARDTVRRYTNMDATHEPAAVMLWADAAFRLASAILSSASPAAPTRNEVLEEAAKFVANFNTQITINGISVMQWAEIMSRDLEISEAIRALKTPESKP